MGNVMVLAEDASQVATREENAAASVMTLYAGLLAEVRADDVHFDRFGAYEAVASPLIAIHSTTTRTKIAMVQMSISQGLFAGGFHRGQQLIPRNVVIEKERRRKMKSSDCSSNGPGS